MISVFRVLIVLDRRVILVPVTPSWPETEVLRTLIKNVTDPSWSGTQTKVLLLSASLTKRMRWRLVKWIKKWRRVNCCSKSTFSLNWRGLGAYKRFRMVSGIKGNDKGGKFLEGATTSRKSWGMHSPQGSVCTWHQLCLAVCISSSSLNPRLIFSKLMKTSFPEGQKVE